MLRAAQSDPQELDKKSFVFWDVTPCTRHTLFIFYIITFPYFEKIKRANMIWLSVCPSYQHLNA
jgi:hypothetical protein